jgi:hypothetical protein
MNWAEVFDMEVCDFFNAREGKRQKLVLYTDKETGKIVKWKIQE